MSHYRDCGCNKVEVFRLQTLSIVNEPQRPVPLIITETETETMSSGTGSNIRNRPGINGSGASTSGGFTAAAAGTTEIRGGAIARRPVTALVLPAKKPLVSTKMRFQSVTHSSLNQEPK